MKTVLAAVVLIGLTGSGAYAECGHDMVKAEKSQSVATLDMSTTASTPPEATSETEEIKPAEAD